MNLFAGVLEPLEDGAATLRTPDGAITVSPQVAVAHGDRAIASLKPIDVSLHAGPPEGSARNVFRGQIEEIAVDGDRARVRLATRPPLMAAVTAGSVERMGLREGRESGPASRRWRSRCRSTSTPVSDRPTGTLAR